MAGQMIEPVFCFTSVGADYSLLFPKKGTSDYVMTRDMPSLKAVTVGLWMKTADTKNEGVALSYALSGRDNELSLFDYRKFQLWVGNSHRYIQIIISF